MKKIVEPNEKIFEAYWVKRKEDKKKYGRNKKKNIIVNKSETISDTR